eukprot:3205066-Amphidinium_carterae.1
MEHARMHDLLVNKWDAIKPCWAHGATVDMSTSPTILQRPWWWSSGYNSLAMTMNLALPQCHTDNLSASQSVHAPNGCLGRFWHQLVPAVCLGQRLSSVVAVWMAASAGRLSCMLMACIGYIYIT